MKNLPDGIAGIQVKGEVNVSSSVVYGGETIKENDSFVLSELELPQKATVIQTCGDVPAIVEILKEQEK